MVNYVEKVKNKIKVETALVSVSDKTNLDYLVRELLSLNPSMFFFSTGGTYNAIENAMSTVPFYGKHNLLSVEAYTGYPEMQGGLVKTLHPKIHAGILAEEFNEEHKEYLKNIGAVPIELVICNLYPFEKIITMDDVTPEKARANIDIGGPSMVRAAAKNYHRVTVITDNNDYIKLIEEELKKNDGRTTLKFRFEMHKKAFNHTAKYDRTIMKYNKKIRFEDIKSTYKRKD